MKIVIAGGRGQLGRHLIPHLRAAGHTVVTLTRQQPPPGDPTQRRWSGSQLGPWARCIDGADVLINLSGRSVDCRYDAANRAQIYDSRLLSTRVLGQAVALAERPPRVWLNASTATIYRDARDRPQDEEHGEIWRGDEPGIPDTWHFSVDVARRWEAELGEAPTTRTRTVALRMAIVMEPAPGGALSVLSRLVRCGLGGTQGDGDQYVSWIHIDDLLRAIDFIIEREDLQGPVNLAAPHPLVNREFMAALRRAWGRTIGLPHARFMLELGALVLRTESELVLKSRRVVPTRLLDAGFRFEHPRWPAAVRDLVARMRDSGRPAHMENALSRMVSTS